VIKNGKEYTVFSIHGIWEPSGKTDTELRMKQSERIVEFIKKFNGPIILCGDFNLRPDTKSVKMLEQELDLRNLVTEFGVTSTRTSLYTKTEERFADYIFVSKDVEVKDFKVLSDEVSDHAALMLEFK
jgi:endonuclease/exonuclease/phosphatase family metal-dependent hydrolase